MVEQLATRMGIAGRYTDLQTMLRESRPDVVHIATPPPSHVAIACAAMQAGCHVFVEKPFAPSAADADLILDCAEKTGRRVSVNYLYNFESPGLRLEKLLANASLGEVVHLDTSYGYNLAGDYGMAVMADPAHWVHRLPGKLFHNVLDHVLAKVVGHLSDDVQVEVMSFRRRAPTGHPMLDVLPDELRFMLRSDKVTVSGMVSAHGRPAQHSLRVIGTLDTVELDYGVRTLVHSARWTQPSALGRLFPPWTQARQLLSNGFANIGQFRRHDFHYFQGMRVLLNRFYDAVEGKGKDPISSSDIRKVCRVIDQIVEQLEPVA